VLKRIALVVALFAAATAQAGQTCNEVPTTPGTVRKALTLARRTHDTLESTGGSVALVGRAGQDLSKWNLRWSHLGFAWRDHPRGRWLIVHMLNQCGTARSELFDEGLGSFFLDDMFRFEALVLVPSSAIQRRLAAVLASDLPRQMHEPRYNMVAYAYSTEYQNSNQWALELLAGASAADLLVATRSEAQAWLKAARFHPTTAEIPAFTRLGARMFRANVAFDDHPFDRRMAGQIDTVSVESIEAFLQRDAETRRFVITLK
jgi:hypothetical protein